MLFFLKPYIFYDTHDPGAEAGDLELWRQLVAKGIAEQVEEGKISEKTVKEVVREVRNAIIPKKTMVFDLEDRGAYLQKQIAKQLIDITKWMTVLEEYEAVLDKVALADTKMKLMQEQANLEYQLKVFQALIMDDELMLLCLIQ